MRIEGNRTSKTLWLSQSDYIEKMLKHFNMNNAKPAPTPLLTTIRLLDRDPLIYIRGEKVKWKDTLGIGNRKYHVCDGGDSTCRCICRRGRQCWEWRPLVQKHKHHLVLNNTTSKSWSKIYIERETHTNSSYCSK